MKLKIIKFYHQLLLVKKQLKVKIPEPKQEDYGFTSSDED